MLSHAEVSNFYYNRQGYSSTTNDALTDFTDTTDGITYLGTSDANVFRWTQVTKGSNGSSGYLTYNSNVQRVGLTATNSLKKADLNGLVEFISSPFKEGYLNVVTVTAGGSGYTSTPTVVITGKGTGATASCTVANGAVTSVAITQTGSGYDQSTNISFTGGGGTGATATVSIASADVQWVKVDKIYKSGLGEDDSTGTPTGIDNTGKGAVVINGIVPTGARVKRIVPKLASDLSDTTKTDVIAKITARNSFGLRYNSDNQQWVIVNSSNLPANTTTLNDPSNWNRQYEGDATNTGIDNSWVLRFNYSATEWEMLARKTQFIIGSPSNLKFTNLNFHNTFSSETSKPLKDNVKILKINPKSTTDPTPLGTDYKFNAFGTFTYQDGYTDPHNLRVSLADPDNDGYPNDPEAFNKILASQTINLGTTTVDGYTYTVVDNANGTTQVNGVSDLQVQYKRIADINPVSNTHLTLPTKRIV